MGIEWRLLRGTVTWPIAAVWWLAAFGLHVVARGSDATATAACAATCLLAGYVDSVILRLPDPLLLAAGACAAMSASWQAAFVSVAIGIGARVVAGSTSLGRGDVKLLAVIGLWLGDPHAVACAVGLAIAGAGGWACARVLAGAVTPTDTMPLGGWIVAASWIVSTMTMLGP